MRARRWIFGLPCLLALACSGAAGKGAAAPDSAEPAGGERAGGAGPAAEPDEVMFLSEDTLEVTGDLYLAYEDREVPFIVLFHQAGWSRGAYREIAPRLNRLGYNCLAVDARSGDEVAEVPNETAARARAADKGTGYADALPDLRAALAWAREEYAQGKLIAWGSSYSASLVLRIAAESPELLDGAIAFSPGEYFQRFGKSPSWIEEAAAGIEETPVFIASARGEEKAWSDIYAAIPSEAKRSFVPETEGNHGSRALWSEFDDSEAYWEAVESFLKEHFPP